MEIAVGMHQDQGKREYQQDSMSIKNFGSIGVLAILADGMGGYEGGEIASKLVSENFREFSIEGDDIGDSLKKYLLKGNDAIAEYKKEHPNVKSMGTTAIAFFMTDKNCQWVSVGDSPLYVIRNRSTISRINENHSVAGLLDLQVKKGEISQDEALSSGQRHMLTSAVSGEDIPQIETSVSWVIKSDDIFILASDGIETITDERIKEIIVGHTPVITQENVQNACEALVHEVLAVGTENQDNVTVIILAKVEDNGLKTAIYSGSGLNTVKKKKFSLLLAIGVGITALIFIGLAVWLMSSGEQKEVVPVVEANITAVQPKSVSTKPVEATVPKPAREEKVGTEQNKTTTKVKSEAKVTLKPNVTTAKKVENINRKKNLKEEAKATQKEKNKSETNSGKIKVITPTKEQIEQAKQDEAG